MAEKRKILSKEEQESRREERRLALHARRERQAELDEIRRIEEEARIKKVLVDQNIFAQICKFGFLTDTTPLGRIEIAFTKIDIENLCSEVKIEKVYNDQVYNFLMLSMDRIQKYNILKNSPLYWQLADRINTI